MLTSPRTSVMQRFVGVFGGVMRRIFGLVLVSIGLVACGNGGGTDGGRPPGDSGAGPVDCTGATAAMGMGPAMTSCGIASCHNTDFAGLRGAVGIASRNLTPDATGLMGWTTAEIARATLDGIDRRGASLCTSMVRYRSVGMTPAQACNIAAYLQSLAPISNAVTDSCM